MGLLQERFSKRTGKQRIDLAMQVVKEILEGSGTLSKSAFPNVSTLQWSSTRTAVPKTDGQCAGVASREEILASGIDIVSILQMF